MRVTKSITLLATLSPTALAANCWKGPVWEFYKAMSGPPSSSRLPPELTNIYTGT